MQRRSGTPRLPKPRLALWTVAVALVGLAPILSAGIAAAREPAAVQAPPHDASVLKQRASSTPSAQTPLALRVRQLEAQVSQLTTRLKAAQQRSPAAAPSGCASPVFIDRGGIRRIVRQCLREGTAEREITTGRTEQQQQPAAPTASLESGSRSGTSAAAPKAAPAPTARGTSETCVFPKTVGPDGVFRVRPECVSAALGSCDLPWREDASGVRHVKRHCLSTG